jgi:hypothetical protein
MRLFSDAAVDGRGVAAEDIRSERGSFGVTAI